MAYINLATYPTAFFMPGGGEVQLLSTLKELSKINKNVNLLKNYDKEIISQTSLFHLFTVCYSIETYVNAIDEMDKKYLLSPIHWPINTELPNNERNRIKHILFNSLKPNFGYSIKFKFLRILKDLILEISFAEAFLKVSCSPFSLIR